MSIWLIIGLYLLVGFIGVLTYSVVSKRNGKPLSSEDLSLVVCFCVPFWGGFLLIWIIIAPFFAMWCIVEYLTNLLSGVSMNDQKDLKDKEADKGAVNEIKKTWSNLDKEYKVLQDMIIRSKEQNG